MQIIRTVVREVQIMWADMAVMEVSQERAELRVSAAVRRPQLQVVAAAVRR